HGRRSSPRFHAANRPLEGLWRVFGTVHAPLFHPIIAAKPCVTADQVGQGRFGLNIVAGWNEARRQNACAASTSSGARRAEGAWSRCGRLVHTGCRVDRERSCWPSQDQALRLGSRSAGRKRRTKPYETLFQAPIVGTNLLP